MEHIQAFIIVAIDIKVEQEKKEASKAKHGKKPQVKPGQASAPIPGKEEAYGPYQVAARTYGRHDRPAQEYQ